MAGGIVADVLAPDSGPCACSSKCSSCCPCASCRLYRGYELARHGSALEAQHALVALAAEGTERVEVNDRGAVIVDGWLAGVIGDGRG